MTPDRMLGRLVGGRYRVHEVLAVGGMGIVYSGAHEGTGRPVAVKVLRPELLTQRDLVRRVAAEARLAVEASHPNVVQVLDAGTDEAGLPYLVLERLYGQPLEALLTEPLPLLTTAQVLVPIANAVAMLHRLGIVHRDIKPANIFLHRDADGRVTPKLLDFGIAKALARGGITFTGAALGTPAYMAPEQALGHHFGGRAVDVWSMGMVLARCLTGRLPFADARVGSVTLRSVLRREHLPDVPDAMALLLGRALAFEPSERLADMSCFRDELLAALAAVDGAAVWPGEDRVTYGPAESVLAEAIATDPAPARQAFSAAFARPRHVDTRTLTGAGALVRGEHARPSRLARAPLVALAAAAALALVSPRGAEHGTPSAPLGTGLARRPTAPPPPPLRPEPRQEASEDTSKAVAASALAAAPAPAGVGPSSGGLWHRASLGTFSGSVSSRAAAVPATRDAAAELAEPGAAAQAVLSPRGALEAPPRFRVGANRAPIIE